MQKTSDSVVLKLEGSVKGPWVEELRKAWLASATMAAGELVRIDLAAVSFVDGRGRDLLLGMKREGANLDGTSSFLRHILEDEKPSEQSSRKIGVRNDYHVPYGMELTEDCATCPCEKMDFFAR